MFQSTFLVVWVTKAKSRKLEFFCKCTFWLTKVLKVCFCGQSLSVIHYFLLQYHLWKCSLYFNQTSHEWYLSGPILQCISRSWGMKGVSKFLHIWYIKLSRGPLLKLFTLCHWGHMITLNNGIFKWLFLHHIGKRNSTAMILVLPSYKVFRMIMLGWVA